MRRLLIALLVLSVGYVGACESSRANKEDPDVPEVAPDEAAVEQMKRIAELRERRTDDAMSAVSGDPSAVATDAIPDEVQAEWDILSPALFGESLELSVEDRVWSNKSRFDSASEQVIYREHPQADEESVFAFSLAANEGIEYLAFHAMEPATSVDQWLAREILRRAGPVFISTLIAAERAQLGVSAEDLAERPELSPNIPVIGERLREEGLKEDAVGADHFEEGLRQLVLRESLSMGAALYRAGSWSAVEWGRIEPPNNSNYAVRPDRWLGGEGAGRWEWPERFDAHREEHEWEEVRTGLVGPALMSLWLESVVDPRAARTIYKGWLTDSYRVHTRGEGEDAVQGFHWVSAWQSPHEAQEIAAAAEAALGHYLGADNRERRFRVAVQGVNVAVVSYTKDYDPELLNQEAELLTEATFGIIPEEAEVFEFQPTLYERYVNMAEESILDEEEWTDPAAGWKVSVEALDGWKVQKSDEAHVRWFATHADGTMIQWTTELLNPLEAEFASEDYLARLEEAFSESVSAQDAPHIEVVNQPVESTIEMEMMGLIDGRPLVLNLWQWRRGDVLVTFSVQGPEQSFGERLSEVEAVLGSLTSVGEEFQARRPREGDDGIIEFRIEDESADNDDNE